MISAYRFDHRQLQQLCRLASDPKALTEAIFRAVAFKSHRGCSGLSPPRRAVHHIRMDHKTLNMPVGGMTCGNCARSVERRLASTPGVTKVTVDLDAATAAVDYDADLVKPQAIADAVRKLGYDVPE